MRIAMLALAAAAMLTACGDDTDHSRRTNLASGLVSFRFGLRSGLGFCPQPGMPYGVEVERLDSGDLTLSGSRLVAIEGSEAACLPNVSTGACLGQVRIAARTLTDQEATRLLDVFAGVTIQKDPASDCGTEDPCVIESFDWTNRRNGSDVSTHAESKGCVPALTERDADAVEETLDALLH